MSVFQSTLPARGATGRVLEADALTIISIHAPRTGSDRFIPMRVACGGYFNPRSPHGERPQALTVCMILPKISIHAPRTGSDLTP